MEKVPSLYYDNALRSIIITDGFQVVCACILFTVEKFACMDTLLARLLLRCMRSKRKLANKLNVSSFALSKFNLLLFRFVFVRIMADRCALSFVYTWIVNLTRDKRKLWYSKLKVVSSSYKISPKESMRFVHWPKWMLLAFGELVNGMQRTHPGFTHLTQRF